MRVYVGVTDLRWYRFLAARPAQTEVKFWNPGGKPLMNLTPGEPFVFKSKSPDNRMVGGGHFNGFVRMPLSDAWRFYGEGNGAASLQELRSLIAGALKVDLSTMGDVEVGCTLLSHVGFLDRSLCPPGPSDWAGSIVRGKSYTGVAAESIVEATLMRLVAGNDETGEADSVGGDVFGVPQMQPNRLGQRAFRSLVFNAYHRRCAITGEKIRPVLQAAHILPLPAGGGNRLDNGLLLRSDVHTLFDGGYLTVDKDYRLRVSPRIKREFDNGYEYYQLEKSQIALPDEQRNRPHREFLEWHGDQVFLAS